VTTSLATSRRDMSRARSVCDRISCGFKWHRQTDRAVVSRAAASHSSTMHTCVCVPLFSSTHDIDDDEIYDWKEIDVKYNFHGVERNAKHKSKTKKKRRDIGCVVDVFVGIMRSCVRVVASFFLCSLLSFSS